MDDVEVSADDIIGEMAMQLADKIRENAILKAQVTALTRRVTELLQGELTRPQPTQEAVQ